MTRSGIRVPAVGFSLIGLIYCLLSVFKMTDVFCITKGCSVYDGFSIFGISLYWFGATAFFILLLTAVIRTGWYLLLTAAFFLTLNMAFLLVQVLLWPCASCLIVAALFGAIMAASILPEKKKWAGRLMMVWFLLFVLNGIAAAKELLAPWPVYGNNEAQIRLYFSPTCPSCRTMIDSLLSRTDVLSRIALYPVSKGPEDTKRIRLLEKMLRDGVPIQDAVIQYQQNTVMNVEWDMDYFRTALNTFKNLMALSRLGVAHVPYLSTGAAFWTEAGKTAPLKDDCPVFSKSPSGLCEDSKPGGLKDIFKSK
jgi:hypothetical protein